MIMNETRPRIGLLGLMQELYDDMIPGITQHQEEYVKQVVSKLSPSLDIYFPGAARNRKDIETYTKEFHDKEMAGIIVVNLVYGPGVNLVRALQNNRLPLLLANIQPEESVSLDWDMNDLTYNQGIHGMQDTANTIIRTIGDNFSIITDDWRSDSFEQYVSDWSKAAQTAAELKKMKIAWFGKMNGMHDTITDFSALMRIVGPEIREERMGEVYRIMEDLTTSEVNAQIEEDRKVYTIDKDLPRENHEHAVKIMLAFEKILEKEGYAGYSANFDVFKGDGRFRQIGLLAASNLMAKGYGYGAEGDVNSTTLVCAGNILCGEANFTEMYAMDFKRNSMLMSHMGEGNWKFARKDKDIRLANRELGIGELDNPPTPVFMVEPGEATISSLIPIKGDHFRLVVMKGKVLDTEEHPNIEMPYFHFSPDSGVKEANTAWLRAGGSHHQAMLMGNQLRKWELLCKILGIEYVEV
jgi:L-arabinose isomerase